jgi:hypothetical protein
LVALLACAACATGGGTSVAKVGAPVVEAPPAAVQPERVSVCDSLSPGGKLLWSAPLVAGDDCIPVLSGTVLIAECERERSTLHRRYDLRGRLLEEKLEPPPPPELEAEALKAYRAVIEAGAALGIDATQSFNGVESADGGHVHWGSNDEGDGVVVRVDAAGAVLWRHVLEADFPGAGARQAGVDNAGNVLVVGTAASGAFLLSLERAHGATQWTARSELPGSIGVRLILTADEIAMIGITPPEPKEPAVLSFFARYSSGGQRSSLRILDRTYQLVDGGGCILAANVAESRGVPPQLRLTAFPY